jgi:tetratricopeptide (TPR) repeat protein
MDRMNKSDLDNSLREAEQHRLAGRLDEAERIYRGVLEAIPESGEIRFLLGCLYVRAGRFAEAAVELQEAVRLLPQFADARIVLGNIFISQHRWSEAVEMLATAAQLRPDLLPVKSNLALALFSAGSSSQSEALYDEILQSNPDNYEARCSLAHILDREGRYEDAERHARMAVDLAPDNPTAIAILGNVLYGLGRTDEAEAAWNRSLAIDPGQLPIYVSLSNAYRDRQMFAEAEEAARRALELNPGFALAMDAIALAQMEAERYDEAVLSFRRAIELEPESGSLLQHMAILHTRMGLFEEAIEYGARAVELSPGPDAYYSLGTDQIRTGRYLEGWKNFEGRLEASELSRRHGIPKWDGSRLEGRTLLVHDEGGFGDSVQFGRFLPLVLERADGRVIFQCLAAMLALLDDFPGVARVMPRGRDVTLPDEPIDCYLSLLSAPAVLGATEETIPPAGLPFRISGDAAADWRRRLAGLPGLKVGICWAGSPGYPDDHNRSMRLEAFAPLADVDGLNLVSLQVGPAAEQVHSDRNIVQILHVPEELSPWMKTAALMRELDLVISVDTATAHLAGALGVETWLLLPCVTHWIWNAYRQDDTRWYPKHRLFRQHRRRDWDSVIDRVRQELLDRIAGVRSVRSTFGQDGQDGQDEHKRS